MKSNKKLYNQLRLVVSLGLITNKKSQISHNQDPNDPNQHWEFLELSGKQFCHNYVKAFMNWPKSDPLSAFLALDLTWFHSQVFSVLSHSFLTLFTHFLPQSHIILWPNIHCLSKMGRWIIWVVCIDILGTKTSECWAQNPFTARPSPNLNLDQTSSFSPNIISFVLHKRIQCQLMFNVL